MANYTDDFEGYTPGSGLPTGWTSRWDTPTAWAIVDNSGDQSLKITPNTNRCFASMDAINSDADRDKVELLAKFRTTSVASGAHAHLVARGSGNGAAETGYVCGILDNDFRLLKYVSGTGTQIGSTVVKDISTATWYWIRFRVNSTSLKGRIWADGGSEPGTWDIDTTDSSITGTGWAGCFDFFGGSGVYSEWTDIAIATNGDTATMSGGPTYTLTAASGSFSLTGNATGLTASRILTAAPGSFGLTGNVANLTAARLLTAGTGSFALTGNDATLTYTPAGGPTYTLTAASGSFALTGNAANLTAARLLSAETGAFSLTGRDAGLYGPGDVIQLPPAPSGGIGHGRKKQKKRVYIERDGKLNVFIDEDHAEAFLQATQAIKKARKLDSAKQIKKAVKAAQQAIDEAKPEIVVPLVSLKTIAPPDSHQARTVEKLIRQAQWAHLVSMYEKWIEDDDEEVLLLAA